MQEERNEWDNISEDKIIKSDKDNSRDPELSETAGNGHMSQEACRIACNEVAWCLQFTWSPGECRLSRTVKFGKSKRPGLSDKTQDNGRGPASGWLFDRMEEWMRNQECKNGGGWILENGVEWDSGTA
jgi:hypothetical protein